MITELVWTGAIGLAAVLLIAVLRAVRRVGEDLDRYANEADGEWLS